MYAKMLVQKIILHRNGNLFWNDYDNRERSAIGFRNGMHEATILTLDPTLFGVVSSFCRNYLTFALLMYMYSSPCFAARSRTSRRLVRLTLPSAGCTTSEIATSVTPRGLRMHSKRGWTMPTERLPTGSVARCVQRRFAYWLCIKDNISGVGVIYQRCPLMLRIGLMVEHARLECEVPSPPPPPPSPPTSINHGGNWV